jgi:hypothetical protein
MDIPPQLVHSLIALFDGGSIVLVVTGVAKTFEWFDGMVSNTGRQALSNQLKNAPSDKRIDSWASIFPRLIDRIFGPNALSLRFFCRSCVASFQAVLLTSLVQARLLHARYIWFHAFRNVEYVLLIAVAANFIPDYMSLVVSRMIVRLMERKRTPAQVSLLLILDTLLTGIVAMFSSCLALTVQLQRGGWELARIRAQFHGQSGWGDIAREYIMHTGWVLYINLRIINIDNLVSLGKYWDAVFFYSAFFTSIWVWLYVLSIGIIKLLHKLRAIWVKVSPYLDIETKPLVAVGRVAGLLAGAGYALILGFIWIGRHWH